MDIKETKKLFKNKIESESVTKQVRDRIKLKTWQRQNMREGFEETFDPLIKSQEKVKKTTDQQQTALINQLQDNQRAITTGLEKIDENNQRMLELNASAGIRLDAASSRSPDIQKNFEISDLMTLNKYGVPRPRDFYKNSRNNLKDVLDITNDEIKTLTTKITGKNNKKSKTSEKKGIKIV